MSTILSMCSIVTGHASTHAAHVVHDQSSSGFVSTQCAGGVVSTWDGGDPRHSGHIALRIVARGDPCGGLRRHAHDRARTGVPLGRGLGADVDHPCAAGRVEMRERRTLHRNPC